MARTSQKERFVAMTDTVVYCALCGGWPAPVKRSNASDRLCEECSKVALVVVR